MPRRKAKKAEGVNILPQEVVDRLEHLATLPPDWDSYGAVPIKPEAIEKTKAMFKQILPLVRKDVPLPFIAPSPDGGVEWEWTVPSGKELLLDIPPDDRPVPFLLVELSDSAEEVETEGTLGDPLALEEAVKRLLSR
ncbi:MAG: hypothetical protein FJ316_11610 [SAR202 cluster bacterium]|nr:hypothetical protein [SAR202 cluster bacterium]